MDLLIDCGIYLYIHKTLEDQVSANQHFTALTSWRKICC